MRSRHFLIVLASWKAPTTLSLAVSTWRPYFLRQTRFIMSVNLVGRMKNSVPQWKILSTLPCLQENIWSGNTRVYRLDNVPCLESEEPQTLEILLEEGLDHVLGEVRDLMGDGVR